MAQTAVKAFVFQTPSADGHSDALSIAEFSSTTFIVDGGVGVDFDFAVEVDAGDSVWAAFMEPTAAPYAVTLQGPAVRARIAVSGYGAGVAAAKVVGTRSMEGSAQAR